MKTKHNKLQVTDEGAVIRSMLSDIADYHKSKNPDRLDAETVRTLGVHSGIRAALLLCITKEHRRTKQPDPIIQHPPT